MVTPFFIVEKMKLIRNVLAIMMTAFISMSLIACGGGDDDSPSSPPNQNGGNSTTTVKVTCTYCQGSGKCYALGTGCSGTGKCKRCNGTGQASYYDRLLGKNTCSLCNGNGICPTCQGNGICNNCHGNGYIEQTVSGGDNSGGGTTTDYTSVKVLKITWIISIDDYSHSTENMYKRSVDGTVYLYSAGKSLKGKASRNTDSKCGPYTVSSYSYRFMTSSPGSIIYYYFD